MSATLAERAVVGVQTPRLSWMPEGEWDFTAAEECIAWARDTLKVLLDEWQKLLLRMMLARDADGKWVCARFALIISRQNGKSLILLIRCLFGLVKLGERKTVFSAHLGDTIAEMFRGAKLLLGGGDKGEVDGLPWKAYGSAGREEIQFTSLRAQMRFKTRTKTGGRGLDGDVVVLDEAQELRDELMEAITPILGSKSMTGNPQLLFAGSAGNFESTVFAKQRRRIIAGDAPRFGGAEWSIDDDAYRAADTFERERIVNSVASFAIANPTYGVARPDGTGGLSEDYLRDEIGDLSPPGFAREHLGVGTWPKDDGHDWIIPRGKWTAQGRPELEVPAGSLVLGISGTWAGRSASIAVVGSGEGDQAHAHGWLERMDRGTVWLLDDLERLAKAHLVAAVVMDAGGPLKTMVADVENVLKPLNVRLEQLDSRNAAAAAGSLYDAVDDDVPTFTHRDQVEVNAALAGARKKDVGSGLWTFDRDKSETDVAPLEAIAYARHGWVIYVAGLDYDVLQSAF